VSGHYYDVHNKCFDFFFSGECAAPDKHEVISREIQMRNFMIFNYLKILFNDDVMRRACITHR